MLALARYIDRGPIQAILVTATLGLFSLVPIFGFLSVFSGASVALVTLRHGPQQGLKIVAGATIIVMLLMTLLQGGTMLAWIMASLLWIPVWAVSIVLRNTVSWSLTLMSTAVLSLLALLTAYIALGDPVEFWRSTLVSLFDLMASQSGGTNQIDLQEQLPAIAEWLTGFLVAALALGIVSSIMVARWWQSVLYHPGGFQKEFHALALPRQSSIAVLFVLMIATVGPGVLGALASDFLMTVMIIYAVVGLGFVHYFVKATNKHVGWLVALYVLLFVALPHAVATLAAVGFSDSWANFRERLPGYSNKEQSDDRENDQK